MKNIIFIVSVIFIAIFLILGCNPDIKKQEDKLDINNITIDGKEIEFGGKE